MQSMTGYARAALEADGRQLTIELKSVNHRFLDINFRMPRSFMFLEDAARKQISSCLARGHIDVFATYKNLRTDAKTVTLNMPLFNAYDQAISQMEGLADDRSMMSFAQLPDLLIVTESDEDREALSALMRETLGTALDELISARKREGDSIKLDLCGRAKSIARINDAIKARYPNTVDEYKERLTTAVSELLNGAIDETRLLTEVALMAEKSSIAEETVRLDSHVESLLCDLESREPVGRRIDFLVQELNREANTMSSKSQDIEITKLTVELKSEIEKLREQIQNIE